MAKYKVEQYPADGHGAPICDGFLEYADTLEEARELCRFYLGVKRLTAARLWHPEPPEVVEAYHDYPPSHSKAYGCGGVGIIEMEVSSTT